VCTSLPKGPRIPAPSPASIAPVIELDFGAMLCSVWPHTHTAVEVELQVGAAGWLPAVHIVLRGVQ